MSNIKPKEVLLTCIVCGERFMGPEPVMCCNGRDCGCMGIPTEPIVCSKECYEKGFPQQKGDTGVPVIGDATTTQLPVNVEAEISYKATIATDAEELRLKENNPHMPYEQMLSKLNGYRTGYMAGATAYANKLLQVEQENRKLKEMVKMATTLGRTYK